MQSKIKLVSLEATKDLAITLAKSAKVHDVITLRGNLGTGKTAFAKAFIAYLVGCPEDEIISPTFNLVQTYDNPNFTIWHYDLYRVKFQKEIIQLDLDEALNTGLVLIEWPEIIEDFLPKRRIDLHFEYDYPDTTRLVSIAMN